MFDKIGNTLREGDLVEFKLPDEYQIVVARIEHLEEGGVIAASGPQGMRMPPKVVVDIQIKCNLTDLTGQGVFRQVVVVKNPKANEPKANT